MTMSKPPPLELDQVLNWVRHELFQATQEHGPFHSPHEGYGILAEEMAELLDALRANDLQQIRAEAIQVAAMAARLVLDCRG